MVVVAAVATGLDESHAATTADMRPHLTVLDGGGLGRRSVEREIHPSTGTMLTQTRQFYDPVKINQLALSLREQGLMHAGELAALTEDQAREYLRVWNKIWGRRYKLEDLQLWEDGAYLIVIAGHCRKKAAMQEVEQGHGVPRNYRAVFQYGISAQEALDRQFQENIHSVPETWEDAEAAYRYWMFLKDQEKKDCRVAKRLKQPIPAELSVAAFATKVGRSETAVRGYIRFGEAPKPIQKAVRTDKISYGKGLILARAFEKGVLDSAEQMNHWLSIAKMPLSTDRFEAALRDRIEKAESQQTDMFGEMNVEQVAKVLEDERRAVVMPEFVRRIRDSAAYFETVVELAEQGQLGPDGAFSAASPARALLVHVEAMKKALPHLRNQVEIKRFAEEIEATLGEAGELLGELVDEPSAPRPQEAGLFD